MTTTSQRRLRVVVADDEPFARSALREAVEADPELELVAECCDGLETVAAVHRFDPEILLLDIQMPEADGFEVLRRLDSTCFPALVFVTAWDDYAVRAFEQRALDYVLKPFPPRRLEDALERAKRRVRDGRLSELARGLLELAEEPPQAGRTYRERLTVTKGIRTVVVEVDDIDWLEAADYYVRLHVGSESQLIRHSLRWFEGELDPEVFVRVHRSAIVNVRRIAELRRLGPDDHVVVLKTGREISASRSGREELLGRLR